MSIVRRHLSLALAGALALSACSTQPATGGGGASGRDGGSGDPATQIKVFATTGYLGDLVKNLDPTASVTVMVKPGGDPHTYQPSTGDITAMRDADVVVSNGVYLEAMMLDQLRSLGDKHLAVGDTVPADKLLPWPEKDAQGNPLHDPHIWNSPETWKIVTKEVANRGADRGRRRRQPAAADRGRARRDAGRRRGRIPGGHGAAGRGRPVRGALSRPVLGGSHPDQHQVRRGTPQRARGPDGDVNLAACTSLIVGGVDVGPLHLWVMLGVIAANAAFLALCWKELGAATFDPAFSQVAGLRPRLLHYALLLDVSLTVTAAFATAGSLLVVALMIVPRRSPGCSPTASRA